MLFLKFLLLQAKHLRMIFSITSTSITIYIIIYAYIVLYFILIEFYSKNYTWELLNYIYCITNALQMPLRFCNLLKNYSSAAAVKISIFMNI